MPLAHIMDYSILHLCIDRNIQPNVTAGICNYNVNNFKIILRMHIITVQIVQKKMCLDLDHIQKCTTSFLTEMIPEVQT